MRIKRKISFKLREYGKVKKAFQIQMHATFNSSRLIMSTGCILQNVKQWDSEMSRVVYHPNSASLNHILNSCYEQMDWVFKYFEINEIVPDKRKVSELYTSRSSGNIPSSKTNDSVRSIRFFEVFDLFVKESAEKNSWTKATCQKMASLREDLLSFNPCIDFSSLGDAVLTEFVTYLRETKHLRTPRRKKSERTTFAPLADDVGLRNSTIYKKLGYLKWFLNWATAEGFNQNVSYKNFKPTLKTTKKRVVFLTPEEIGKLRAVKFPKENSSLEAVRDVFLFCCYSGLRHSDVYNLRRTDVYPDRIEITTVKTSDSIVVDLNNTTKSILEKYSKFPFNDNKALPVIENQPMNKALKMLCKMAGINDSIRVTTYRGSQRIDEIKEKWELIGTHTGRRTFIVMCLSKGIPPNIVMKWTGHSDYKSMMPYIDIVDSTKVSAMQKLND